MLLLNITPIYLRCGVLLSKANNLSEEIFSLKEKFKYINPENNIVYQDKILFLFKLSYFKVNDFKDSPDFGFLKNKIRIIEDFNLDENEKEILEKNKNNNIIISESHIKNKLIKKCYYCGELTGKREFLIYNLFKKKCVQLGNANELIIKGIDFLSNNTKNTFFNLPKKPAADLICVGQGIKKAEKKNYMNLKNNLYPYLLALGQEGVSIYKVNSINSFEKIGGNSFGPSTLWSLFTYSCGYDSPDLACEGAANGNNKLNDLSVGDIYGGNYENMSLSSDLIGSSFGKFKNIDDINNVDKRDVAKSLVILYGATYSHITSLVSLKENINKVIISGNPFYSLEIFQIIQTSIERYSSNTIGAIFNDYSDYFEIIGMVIDLYNKDLFEI